MHSSELKEILKLYNLQNPKKSFGQNFLLNDEVLDNIVDFGELDGNDEVIEIGPGLGALTSRLAGKSKILNIVELDDSLFDFLKVQLLKYKNINFINDDIIRVNILDLVKSDSYKIIANIPYNITSKILRKFTEIEKKPELMVLLIQKEVGQRVTAKVGALSILAVVMQFHFDIELKEIVSRNDFYPAPKVDSAIVKFVNKNEHLEKLKSYNLSEKDLWRIVKIGFSARRKKLYNNLENALHLGTDKIKSILESLSLSPDLRAQDLTVGDWIKLTRELK